MVTTAAPVEHTRSTLEFLSDAAKLAALIAVHGDMLKGSEVRRMLGLSKSRVSQLGQARTLRPFPVGREVYYPLSDVLAWGKLKDEGKIRRGPPLGSHNRRPAGMPE